MHPQYPQLGQAGWGRRREGHRQPLSCASCVPRPTWLKYLWDDPLPAQLTALAVPVGRWPAGGQPHSGGDKPSTDPVPHRQLSVKSLVWVSNLGGVGAHGALKKNFKTVTSTF